MSSISLSLGYTTSNGLVLHIHLDAKAAKGLWLMQHSQGYIPKRRQLKAKRRLRSVSVYFVLQKHKELFGCYGRGSQARKWGCLVSPNFLLSELLVF